MNKTTLLKLIHECACELGLQTESLNEDPRIITTSLKQISECVDLFTSTKDENDRRKYIRYIRQACDIIEKNISTVDKVDEGINDDLGAWRRLVITTTNSSQFLEDLNKYTESKKADFPNVKIKTIESPVKPGTIVSDFSGQGGLAYAKKCKEWCEKHPAVTKVMIRDDVKLKPKK